MKVCTVVNQQRLAILKTSSACHSVSMRIKTRAERECNSAAADGARWP